MVFGARPFGTRTFGDTAPTDSVIGDAAGALTEVTPEDSKILVKSDQAALTVVGFQMVGVVPV